MEKIDDTIIGKLFWDRCCDIGNQKNYELLKKQFSENAKKDYERERLCDLYKSTVKDEQKIGELEEILEEYSNHLWHEMSFENIFFYKLGFKDGYQLYNELEEIETQR